MQKYGILGINETEGEIMKRFLTTLLSVSMLLLLTACSNPEPSVTNTEMEVPEGYTVYPHNAHTIMYTKHVRNPPKTIFTKPKEATGVFGNMFKFVGEVVSVNIGDNYNDVILHTEDGYIKIIDLYSLLVKDSPSVETDELNERFSIPEVGENVCIYAEYSGGNSNVFGCPVAYIGGRPTVARMTSNSTQYINSLIYENYIAPKIEETENESTETSKKEFDPDMIAWLIDQSISEDLFEGHSVSYDGEFFNVNVWTDAFAERYENSTEIESLNEIKKSLISVTNALEGFARAGDFSGISDKIFVKMNVLDENDHSRTLLSIANSEIVYDILEE